MTELTLPEIKVRIDSPEDAKMLAEFNSLPDEVKFGLLFNIRPDFKEMVTEMVWERLQDRS